MCTLSLPSLDFLAENNEDANNADASPEVTIEEAELHFDHLIQSVQEYVESDVKQCNETNICNNSIKNKDIKSCKDQLITIKEDWSPQIKAMMRKRNEKKLATAKHRETIDGEKNPMKRKKDVLHICPWSQISDIKKDFNCYVAYFL